MQLNMERRMELVLKTISKKPMTTMMIAEKLSVPYRTVIYCLAKLRESSQIKIVDMGRAPPMWIKKEAYMNAEPPPSRIDSIAHAMARKATEVKQTKKGKKK